MSRSYAIQIVGAYAAIIGSAQAAQPLHIAFVQDRAICTIIDSAPTNCFGAVNVQISLPVWSRDGTKIAYIENTNSAQALATLVIVDKFGQGLSRTAITPLPNGEVRSGMRFVESVKWIGPDQVAVSGSVNPSTTEYLVVDLLRGVVANQYIDAGHGARFSPDGKHVAYVEAAPHFTALADRTAALRVDGVEVLKLPSADSTKFGPPMWSADVASLATSLHDSSGKQRIAHWNANGGGLRLVDLPFHVAGRDEKTSVFWSGSNLYLKRATATANSVAAASRPGAKAISTETWVLKVNRQTAQWQPAKTADLAAEAASLRRQALNSALPAGARDADVWCAACAIGNAARRVGANAD